MPEQEPTNSKSSASLDDLFKVAEAEGAVTPAAQAAQASVRGDAAAPNSRVVAGAGATTGSGEPVPVSPKIKQIPCDHVDNTMRRLCPICKELFCPDCSATIDPSCCRLCLKETDAELHGGPLVDQDGVTHEGRLLTPGPVFGTLAKRVSEMTEYELEQHVERYKGLIKQAETALDFRRVTLAMGQMEQAQRADQQRRRLRGVKVPRARTIGVPADPSKPKKAAPDLTRMVQMIQAIQKLRDLKNKQAKPGGATDAANNEPKL